MANGTAETLTPDGDADEQRGIEIAELYANLHTVDGTLRTTEDVQLPTVPEQRVPVHDMLDEEVFVDVENEVVPPSSVEGGKALYGAFDPRIRFAGGLSIEATVRGHDIARVRHRRSSYIGRNVVPRIVPGGR